MTEMSIHQEDMTVIYMHAPNNILVDIENKLIVTKGERGKRDKSGVWA